ncbi:pyridoxamine 5'-phosphate oxidase family protein [Streptomyces sp. NPDC096311]|uniref:pyridoxamine 5'-phosphate oxidase family protein n=1 Tax=Streptomyces sp. NPDC096311 TaxID=3366083 RepID=UPI003815E013
MSETSQTDAGGVTISPDLRAFITGVRRVVKVGVARDNGDPWLQPAWFDVDGDDLIALISAESMLGRTIERERAVCVCVDDIEIPYAFAVLEGYASAVEDASEAEHWLEKLLGKYRGDLPPAAGRARTLLDDGLKLIQIQLNNVYFEPVVSPPPASASNEGAHA